MNTLERVKKYLVPGRVYRRADLAALSSNIDRHLKALVSSGHLKKISRGLYAAPNMSVFGEAPPNENFLLRAFLKDDRFVAYNTSQFNSLGLGSTQLYNTRVVFNRKRTGNMSVGGRDYVFRLWREAPKSLSKEFLVVELLNQLNNLAEDHTTLLQNLKSRLNKMDLRRLRTSATRFGTLSTQKKLNELLK